MAMAVTMDYYSLYNLDPKSSTKDLHKVVMGLYAKWQNRLNATTDTNILEKIRANIEQLRDATRWFRNDMQRKKYDDALDKAYKNGSIRDEQVDKLKSLLEQAKAYFDDGKFVLAAKCAEQIISQDVRNEEAYIILGDSYMLSDNYEYGISTFEKALKIFPDNLYFKVQTVESDIFYKNNKELAQQKLNDILAEKPDNELVNVLQIKLYVHYDETDLAFSEIDKFVNSHPDCNFFKENVANILASHSLQYYVSDVENEGSKFIMSKKDYNSSLSLCQKAYNLYQNNYTKDMLEEAKYFGKVEFNKDNLYRIGFIAIMIIILFCNSSTENLGFLAILVEGLLIFFSFRPYWQLNRIYLTGWTGPAEAIVILISSVLTLIVKFWISLLIVIIYLFVGEFNLPNLIWGVKYIWDFTIDEFVFAVKMAFRTLYHAIIGAYNMANKNKQ